MLLATDEAPEEAPQGASSKQSRGAAKKQVTEKRGSDFSLHFDAPAKAPKAAKAERAAKRSREEPEDKGPPSNPGPQGFVFAAEQAPLPALPAPPSGAAAASSSAGSSAQAPRPHNPFRLLPDYEMALVGRVALAVRLQQAFAASPCLMHLEGEEEQALFRECMSKGPKHFPQKLREKIEEYGFKAAERADKLIHEGSFLGVICILLPPLDFGVFRKTKFPSPGPCIGGNAWQA